MEKVLRGTEKPEKVHFVELVIDEEIKRFITENLLAEKWIPCTQQSKEEYLLQEIRFWYKMGYDYIRLTGAGEATLNWARKKRETEDTADLSRGKRNWVEEGKGMISSWEEFDKYPWPDPKEIDYWPYEFVSKNLPEGMKMMVCPSDGVFETVGESLLGFENMSYLLSDDFDLVEAVFNRVGEIIYDFYKNAVELENVGGFFQGDDLGFKTGTFLSPSHLRRLVLPWHKKFAELAHKHQKMYWFHCCGNLLNLMEDIIEDVRIDAFHSFQDVIIPVVEFKKRYGSRIASLGGIDLDKLARFDELRLRSYVRDVLEKSLPGGRYALGSGNSISNYVPVGNYIAMLDEGLNWEG